MTKSAKRIIHIAGVFLLAAALQALLTLCLQFYRGSWSEGVFIFTMTFGTVLNAAMFAVETAFFLKGSQLVYKAILSAYVLLVFALAVLLVLQKTGFFEIVRDAESLEEYLEKAGSWMSFAFIALQFLQVVILPIPSFVTVAAGSALFGPLRGAIYSLIGIVLGSLTAFVIGRVVGYLAVAWIGGKDTLDKWLKKIKGKDKLLLSAMFLLPVFPDDVLCFVAGLSSMSWGFFLVVILISRVLAIVTTSYSVTLIPFNTWWGIALWIAFFAAVIVLFVFLYKKADRIQDWIIKKFRRETRVKRETKKDEFTLQVVDPDGSIVEKGVPKGEETTERSASPRDGNMHK